MTCSQLLTVAIPTFNRNEILARNLAGLLPQLTDACQLLIVDNSSDVPVAETIGPLLEQYPAVAVTCVRNQANIGGNANIMRCFELCASDYVWVLGDDDTVHPDAISTVLGAIAAHPETLLLNFACELHERTQAFRTTGLSGFSAALDSFPNALFTSTNVYRCSVLRDYIRMGYHYAYSMAPHLVLLLSALGERGECVFFADRIVRWQLAPVGHRWSRVNQYLGLGTLLEVIPGHRSRRELARRLLPGYELEKVTIELLTLSQADRRRARFLLNQIRCRIVRSAGSPLIRLRCWFYSHVLFVHPPLALAVGGAVARLLPVDSSCFDTNDMGERL